MKIRAHIKNFSTYLPVLLKLDWRGLAKSPYNLKVNKNFSIVYLHRSKAGGNPTLLPCKISTEAFIGLMSKWIVNQPKTIIIANEAGNLGLK